MTEDKIRFSSLLQDVHFISVVRTNDNFTACSQSNKMRCNQYVRSIKAEVCLKVVVCQFESGVTVMRHGI